MAPSGEAATPILDVARPLSRLLPMEETEAAGEGRVRQGVRSKPGASHELQLGGGGV